jgi:hypothetical protein
MRTLAVVLLALATVTCGGGGNGKSKDWSGASLLERAVDFCVKQSACTDNETTVAACLESMADLQALPATVPTRLDLEELQSLRDCYNRARTCEAVQDCAGVATTDDPKECDPATFGASCASRMGVETLKKCVNGFVLEVDCTKLGLVCAFDSDGKNRCVDGKCNFIEYTPTCDAGSGALSTCGAIGAPNPGSTVYDYECGAIGMGCALDLGDPDDHADDIYVCTGREESCDPAGVAPSCDGTTLAECVQNLDGTGNTARWDCASGAIHRTCDASVPGCTPTATTCDPTTDQGSCDGDNLVVCVDGTVQTIDCQEHGLATCRQGTPALCADSK